MRTALSGLVLMIAGCGATVTPPRNETHATSPAGRPCPLDLARRLQGDDDRPMEMVACEAGKFPKPGWAAAYRFQHADGAVNLAIVDGARIVKGEVSAMSFGPMATADLDGDGVDEIVAATSASALFGEEAHDARRIVAIALRGGELKELGDALAFGTIKQYSSQESIYECTAAHALERDPGGGMRLVVTFEPEVGHRDDRTCPAAGRHTYRIAGDKLTETAAK